MSDSTRFTCDYAKRKANCKKCKQPIDKGLPRIAKVTPNFFNEGEGEMKNYHHINCMFEVFSKARATTKKVEDPSDLEGFSDMQDAEKDLIRKLIADLLQKQASKASSSKGGKKTAKSQPAKSPAKSPAKASTSTKSPAKISPVNVKSPKSSPTKRVVTPSKDNNFREFRRICSMIAEEPSYNEKSNIVKRFITKGCSGSGYTGDLLIFIKLLLPGSVKRTYNIQSRTIVKIFSKIFDTDLDDMMEDLEQGDVSETVFKFFEDSEGCPPCKKSTLTIHDVDHKLDTLQGLTREDDQEAVLRSIAKKSTANDLKAIIRLIKGDLRITAGAKHILDALHPSAHEAFKASRDLEDVISRIEEQKKSGGDTLEVRASLMTPVAPMLAEACKSVEQAMKKCPNGMYSEIKYDGERVQLHMKGGEFQFYSRSLKQVQKHKVAHFDEVIPKAFPDGHSMILDSEVLLVDNNTGIPLPFGTLGVHKKAKFASASVCLFIFDIIHFNGENLMQKPICERRKILSENIKEIKNRVMMSEMQFVNKPDELKDMIVRVIKDGLEGLVLKDIKGFYEPGKRHWLKVKKDYLMQGAMADTADLVVLGAYYGTGNKGGIMSVFLMGVHDPKTDTWRTVTKVGNGHDDNALDKINKNLKVVKISKDFKKVPKWLSLNRQYAPDLVVEDPKKAPVWEITGTEFSKSEAHTADGISIRFPRVTKIRNDKDWKTATNLPRLKILFEKSKEESDVSALLGVQDKVKTEAPSPSKSSPNKRKGDSSWTDNVKSVAKKPKSEGKASFLRDLFSGMKVYISSGVSKFEKLKRYLIAYDADIVEEYDQQSATHAILAENEDISDEKYEDIPKDVTKWTEKDAWDKIRSGKS